MKSGRTGGIFGTQISNSRRCSIVDINSGDTLQAAGAQTGQGTSIITVRYERNGSIASPTPAFEGTIAQIAITDFKAS